MSLPQRLNMQCVDSVYESALDGDFFNALLDLMHRLLPRAAIILYSQDSAGPAANYVMHRNLQRDAARSYALESVADNPWFEAQWAIPVAHTYQDYDLMDLEDFHETTFYRLWLSKQDAPELATGLVISRRGTRQLVLEVRFESEDEDKWRGEATSILDAMAPHLVRAMRIFNLRYNHPFERELSANLLELFCFPAVLLAADCRTVTFNARADRFFRERSVMFLTADGYLHARDAGVDVQFQEAVRRLSQASRRGAEVFAFRSEGRSERCFISLAAIGEIGGTDYSPGKPVGEHGHRIAILIQDSAEALRLTHDSLWQVFGLTPAESDLARSLLEGHTIAEFAMLRQVSKQTLRNQLVSIMRKTGTSRQPQLLALLTRIAVSTSS